ncbi:hypothetical protein PP404_06295 [Mycobacteroides abscessus]|nr:hypothetical protein [Mycobacteroides abscessus]MDM2176023.1 hypothetical protein [Mycobacteroides abscessus]MDM2207079.1 hypothetical protein [Mycobacteroides abscessus]MDM2210173.1 hypothetical protein [Mycobacteroides abscessus]MDM2217355.1 hypothetical protein [Mycobacteroides abscessus]
MAGFTVKLVAPDGSDWEDNFAADGSAYWVGPGGTLIAYGNTYDKEARWRVYAPGQWLEVRASDGPAALND